MQRIMRTWILSLFLAGFFLSVLPGYAAGQVARAPGLGRYDEQYGYPAPKWFQELEVVDAVSSDPATAGKLEFSHPSGGFQAAKAGWYAAGREGPHHGAARPGTAGRTRAWRPVRPGTPRVRAPRLIRTTPCSASLSMSWA